MKNQVNQLINSEQIPNLTDDDELETMTPHQGSTIQKKLNNNYQKNKIKSNTFKQIKKNSGNIFIAIILIGLVLVVIYQQKLTKFQHKDKSSHLPSSINTNKKQQMQQVKTDKQKQEIQREVSSILTKLYNIPQQKIDSLSSIDKQNNSELKKMLEISKFYDIHSFSQDQHTRNPYKVLLKSQQNYKSKNRINLAITKSVKQLDDIINSMMHPTYRASKQSNMIEDLSYFYFQLSKQPNNKNYLQAQYYHYDKLYDIGKYDKQLQLCVILTGKNSAKTVQRMYDSINRQNYTNYKIVHIDDNSNDDTVSILLRYLLSKPYIKQKTTFVVQQIQRNQLFNHNFAVMNYCNENDIVIDLQTDDWFIGNQVFQLINSLYQKGNNIDNKRQQLWYAMINSIGTNQEQKSFDISRSKLIQPINFRNQQKWRASQLHTYRKKLYLKVNKGQFVDNLMIKQRQFYSQKSDRFIQVAMIQMSSPKHIRYINQFPYFHNQKLSKRDITQTFYATAVIQSLPPYKSLESIQSEPQRDYNFEVKQNLLHQLKQRKSQIQNKRQSLKITVNEHLNSKNTEFDRTIIDRIEVREIFNKQQQGKQFGKQEQFFINLKGKGQPNRKPNFDYAAHGIEATIQVGSQYDYVNMSRFVNFTQLYDKLFHSAAHQILSFKYNPSLDVQPQKMQYKVFQNEQAVQNYIDKLDMRTPNGEKVDNFEYYLSTKVLLPYVDQLTRQLEYYHTNKKYKISEINNQIPICVFASGYKLFTRNRYKMFFESVEKLNYTNYKIVWIDDYSPDNSAYQIYEYLRTSNMKLKNKIKMIHNLQRIGIMGNMHLYIKNYCGSQDIVLIVDGDDSLIGTQVFQILNSIYQNQDYWFVYTRFLLRDAAMIKDYQIDQYSMGMSTGKLTVPPHQYRTADRWVTSHLRTFRKKVIDGVPLEHFIQYHYNKQTGIAFPRYYGSSADRFQVYSNLEVAGFDRIYHITDFLYNYDYNIPQFCYRRHQVMDQYKCKLKTPVLPLREGQKTSKYVPNYVVPQKVLTHLKKVYPDHTECKKKMGWD